MNGGETLGSGAEEQPLRPAGVLHGVGLGPGDPELLTLRAVRLIRAADLVAYPAPLSNGAPGASFARSIAAGAGALDHGPEELRLDIPMTRARAPAQAAYDAAADALSKPLAEGRTVALLCEGDPFFYGSFMYLFARLGGRFEAQVTPGVTSLTACAAALGAPLVARDAPLTVLPGTLEPAALEARLRAAAASGEAVAILKVGRRLSALRRLVDDAGLLARAGYVGHASLPAQQAVPLAEAPADAPYFSMILIPGEDPHV